MVLGFRSFFGPFDPLRGHIHSCRACPGFPFCRLHNMPRQVPLLRTLHCLSPGLRSFVGALGRMFLPVSHLSRVSLLTCPACFGNKRRPLLSLSLSLSFDLFSSYIFLSSSFAFPCLTSHLSSALGDFCAFFCIVFHLPRGHMILISHLSPACLPFVFHYNLSVLDRTMLLWSPTSVPLLSPYPWGLGSHHLAIAHHLSAVSLSYLFCQ